MPIIRLKKMKFETEKGYSVYKGDYVTILFNTNEMIDATPKEANDRSPKHTHIRFRAALVGAHDVLESIDEIEKLIEKKNK